MFSKTGRFRRADRLLRNQDFKRVVKTGKHRVSKHFVVVITREVDLPARQSAESRLASKPPFSRPHSGPRLGVTVSKRVGNSVVRNRIKRLVREWFRCARAGLPDRSDIVVIARHTARGLSGSEAAALLDQTIHGPQTGSNRPSAVGAR